MTENEDSLFRLCSKVPLDSGLQPALLRAPIPPVQVCENYRQIGIQIAWRLESLTSSNTAITCALCFTSSAVNVGAVVRSI